MHQPTQLNAHHDARTLLHSIAQELTDIRPWADISRNVRTVAMPLACYTHHGYTHHADTIHSIALDLMPSPRPAETRGEYALRLRAAAGKQAA